MEVPKTAKKLVEFVPNFSEGRDKAKVEKIVDEARKISGLKIRLFQLTRTT